MDESGGIVKQPDDRGSANVSMLRLNLIPPEKRIVKKTPPIVFMVLVAAILICLGTAFFIIKVSISIGEERARREEIQGKLAGLSNDLMKYEGIISEISTIESVTSEVDSVINKSVYISDMLAAMMQVLSAGEGVRITEIELLPDDKVKKFSKESENYKFGLRFEGECSSCFSGGNVSTKPLEFIKWRLIKNPELKRYSPVVVNNEPYKVSRDSNSNSTIIKYDFVILGN